MKRRPCATCGRNRSEKFFVSEKGRICETCRKASRRGNTKDARLRETYDITIEEWNDILLMQGGCCAICGGKRTTYDTDHDHKKEREEGTRASIRGLLCKRCNRRLLPAALDSVAILQRAIMYLTHPPARLVLDREESE